MKEIIAIIRPERYLPTIEAVMELGVEEIMDQRVLGRGRQGGLRYLVSANGRPEEAVQFLPKRMLTWLVPEDKMGLTVEAIMHINGIPLTVTARFLSALSLFALAIMAVMLHEGAHYIAAAILGIPIAHFALFDPKYFAPVFYYIDTSGIHSFAAKLKYRTMNLAME